MSETGVHSELLERGKNEVDALCAKIERDEKLTLGSIVEVIEAAISHGVPLYNEGEPRACYELYSETAQQLVTLAEHHAGKTSHRSSDVLEDLERAIDRAQLASDYSEAAWAMRHAFDRAMLEFRIAARRLNGLIELGKLAFLRGDFGGAVDALRPAVTLADEEVDSISTQGESPRTPPIAHIFYGHALMATARYHESAEHLRRGIEDMPSWLESEFELEELVRHNHQLRQQIEALEVHRNARPGDDDATFLSAYLAYFRGDDRRALRLLQGLVQRNPSDDSICRLFAAASSRQPGGEGQSPN